VCFLSNLDDIFFTLHFIFQIVGLLSLQFLQ
jgi:hypothetical protein